MGIDFNEIKRKREERAKSFHTKPHELDDLKVGNILSDLEEANADMSEQQMPRISENMFVEHYLKPFFGIGDTMEDNYAKYVEWTNDIARHPNQSVRVCDNNNPNTTLFIVPPIANVNIINPAKADSRMVSRSLSMADNARFLSPLGFKQIERDSLDGILKTTLDKESIKGGDRDEWIKIYIRYQQLLDGKRPVGKVEMIIPDGMKDTVEQVAPAAVKKADDYEMVDDDF